jgi:hypothetical protein
MVFFWQILNNMVFTNLPDGKSIITNDGRSPVFTFKNPFMEI